MHSVLYSIVERNTTQLFVKGLKKDVKPGENNKEIICYSNQAVHHSLQTEDLIYPLSAYP